MKSIYEVKAKKTMAAPGVWDYEAEAKVTGPDITEEKYVYVATDGENRTYRVNGKSIMEELSADAADGADDDGFSEALVKYAHGELSPEEIEKWGFGRPVNPYDEEYDALSAAKESEYYPVFKALGDLLKAMAKEI